MMRSMEIIVAFAAAAFLPCVNAQDFRDVAGGRLALELRPRYNVIEEGGYADDARGFTYRAIVGWRSAPWNGLRATVEGIATGPIGSKRWNDDGSQIGTSPYPLLPDPDHAGLNRAFVDFTGVEGLHVRAGRQGVRLENQRWVSDNDFRQIPQLFDGVSAAWTGVPSTILEAGWFGRMRDTSGNDKSLRLVTLRAAYNPAPGHSVAAYGVFHDQPDNVAFTGFANESYHVAGVRAEGEFSLPIGVEMPYTAEWARQRPYAGGDSRIRARYWRAGAGLEHGPVLARFDYETRGSNGGVYGLQAPLTDFYAFNGWTLNYFNVPRQGLVDRWLTARWNAGPVTLYGEAHRFRPDVGGGNYGRETDLGATWDVQPGLTVRLQHARYDPGTWADSRIRKTWLTATFTY